MGDPVRHHYELYPYPRYPLLASVRRQDTYALNLEALWARFNGGLPPLAARRILVAGCGSFAPYPFAVANPKAELVALDLSRRSLKRAALHCFLHGHGGVRFRQGDLLAPEAVAGRFGLIDSYGVLHHLPDPLAGLRALAERLIPGGILRLMVYSRYARWEEEVLRRACRRFQLADPGAIRRLIAASPPDSRWRQFAAASEEARFDAGLADALLHPRVRTYRIDAFMELVGQSGLEPLLFAHRQALPVVAQEVARIRMMEKERDAPGNFILYLGKEVRGPGWREEDSSLLLNPCLRGSVGRFHLRPVEVAPRLGHPNPRLGWRERQFLQRFLRPQSWAGLGAEERAMVAAYREALFLLQYRG